MKQGFTLIEILIVLAVIGILIAIGLPNYTTWRANTVTKEAAQQLASDIDKQRTEAKRTNTPRKLEMTSGSSSYKLVDAAGTARSIPLPSGTQLVVPAGKTPSFSFQQPYGTVLDADISKLPFQYEIQWLANPSIKRTVKVVSLTGKVIIQ